MATSSRGPGRSSRTGKSQGRTTRPARHEGNATGRYLSAEERGRYTPPTPKSVYHSARWYGPFILTMFLLGVLTIAFNYLGALPGAVSPWYLLVGAGFVFIGFWALVRYR